LPIATPRRFNEHNRLICNIDLFLPVINCHLEIKDSGPEEHADYETVAMSSSTIVEEGDES
jgi:hypothetical protein